MIKAGILGATGYAGVELARLLLRHPAAELAAVGSVSFEGQALDTVYPALRGVCSLSCEGADAVVEKSDVVFAALPHGLSQDTAAACAAAGKKFIDLGADFRLDDPEEYARWYGCEAKYPALHERAVYGLPELFREEIKATDIVGNPGCYPTSVALGLAPALREGAGGTAGHCGGLPSPAPPARAVSRPRTPTSPTATRRFPPIRWPATATPPKSNRP